LIDKDISGMSWIQLPKKKYHLVPKKNKYSKCDNEFIISCDDL